MSPVDQIYVNGPLPEVTVAVSMAVSPKQIVASLTLTSGKGNTVTVAYAVSEGHPLTPSPLPSRLCSYQVQHKWLQ